MQNFKISDFNRLTPGNQLEHKFRQLLDDLYTIRFDEHANIIDAIDLYVYDFEEINPLRNVFLTPMNKKRIDYLCYELIQSMKDYLFQICSNMSNQKGLKREELIRSKHYINSLIDEVQNILL